MLRLNWIILGFILALTLWLGWRLHTAPKTVDPVTGVIKEANPF